MVWLGAACTLVTEARADSPQELFAIARELAATGDAAAADAAWRQGLEVFGDDAYTRIEYGGLLAQWGRLAQAAEQFEVAVDLAPDNPDVLWAAGTFLRRHPESRPDALERSETLLLSLMEDQPDNDRGWLELGVLALSRRDFQLAAERFELARDIAPFNLAAAGYLAEALVRGGNLEQAEVVLADLVEKDPSQLRARLALSRMYADRQDVSSAIAILRSTPEEQASDPTVTRRLAFLLADARETDEAAQLVDDLLDQSPGDLELRRLAVRLESASGRYESAAETLQVYVRASPEDVSAAIELAGYLEMLDRGKEAVDTLRLTQAAAATTSDGFRRLQFYLLDLLGRRGDWSGVLAETQPLVEAAEPDWSVFPLHAEALANEVGIRSARRFLAKAAEANPDLQPATDAKLAELLLAEGRERQAREVLAGLTAAEGSLGPSLAARVWSIRDRPDEALAPAAEAVKRSPDNPGLRFQLASTLDQAQRWPEAEQELLAILESDPDYAPALNYLGYTWAERSDDPAKLKRALEMTRQAVELNPDNGAYQDSLGWAYFRLGRYQEARPHLEQAAALISNDPVILEHLGDLYRALGETSRARVFYRWAVRIDGGNVDLSNKLVQLPEDG